MKKLAFLSVTSILPRSTVRLDAVHVRAVRHGLTRPARLLTAPSGMFGQPPGMLPPELCESWAAQAPMLAMETVPGANHYTIILDPGHAATVARRLTEA